MSTAIGEYAGTARSAAYNAGFRLGRAQVSRHLQAPRHRLVIRKGLTDVIAGLLLPEGLCTSRGRIGARSVLEGLPGSTLERNLEDTTVLICRRIMGHLT